MGRRSHTRHLALWMNGDRVGTWSHSPAAEELRYDDAWVASPQGRPLSLSLPFRPGNPAHRGSPVQAYFENLLPDSRPIRQRIAQRFRTNSTDTFDLLAEVGRDCAGALYIAPVDTTRRRAAVSMPNRSTKPQWPDCCAPPALPEWLGFGSKSRMSCASPSQGLRKRQHCFGTRADGGGQRA